MRLILLRHGETLWNKEHRLQGHENSPLSEKGILQAEAISPLIQQLSPANVVCSDLGRTVQTSEIIGYPNAIKDKNLRELNMGSWAGRVKADIIKECPTQYQAWREGIFTPNGAESWQAFCQRISQALKDWMKKSEGDLLTVVHSGVIRAACYSFLNLSQKHLLPVTQGTLTIFDFDNDTFKLEAYNLGGLSPVKDVAD